MVMNRISIIKTYSNDKENIDMNQFYTVQERNGKWYFIDDQNKPFYSLGVNCFNYEIGIPMEQKLIDKYGPNDWYAKWAEAKLNGAWDLGFNTLAAWHAQYFMTKRIPRTYEIRCSRHAKFINNGWGGYGFPDVFDPSFVRSIHKEMVDTYYNKGYRAADDETLIGVYTDNELHWWGTGGQWGMDDPGEGTDGTNLVEDYIRMPADSYGKKAWVDYVTDRYQTIDHLNEIWHADYESFEDLLWIKEYRTVKPVYIQDKLGFLEIIAEKYFKTTTEILRMYDKNHLLLGCRLVGTSTPDIVLKVMGKYIDVMSINFYSFDLPESYLKHAYEITGKPMMITEFSFCAGRSAGFDLITNGAQLAHVRDQKQRGDSYKHFVKQAASLPYMIGTHWFALYDFLDRQGLIGNYGLYDKDDNLWSEFAEAVKETHEDILDSLTGV